MANNVERTLPTPTTSSTPLQLGVIPFQEEIQPSFTAAFSMLPGHYSSVARTAPHAVTSTPPIGSLPRTPVLPGNDNGLYDALQPLSQPPWQLSPHLLLPVDGMIVSADDGTWTERHPGYTDPYNNMQQYEALVYEATPQQLYDAHTPYAWPKTAPAAASPPLGYNHPSPPRLQEPTQPQQTIRKDHGAPRKKIQHACQHCRRRKRRCDGVAPICGNCETGELKCDFDPNYNPDDDFADPRHIAYAQELRRKLKKMEFQLKLLQRQKGMARTRSTTSRQVPLQTNAAIERPITLAVTDILDLQELVDSYFQHHYPLAPLNLLHRPSFIDQVKKRQIFNSLLLYAVSALGAQHSQREAIVNGRSIRGCQRGQQFYRLARSLVSEIVDTTPTCDTIIALLLLERYAFGLGEVQAATTFASMAIRLARFLNYNVDPDERADKPTSWLEKEKQRRVWWCCYLIDSWLSASVVRPSGCEVKLPSPERLWAIADIHDINPPQPDIYESRPPVFPTQIGPSQPYVGDIPSHTPGAPSLLVPALTPIGYNQFASWIGTASLGYLPYTDIVIQPPEPDVYVHLIEARLFLTRAVSYRIERVAPRSTQVHVGNRKFGCDGMYTDVYNKNHLESTVVGRLRVIYAWDKDYRMEAKEKEEYAKDLPTFDDEIKRWWDGLPEEFRNLNIHSAGFQPSLTSNSPWLLCFLHITYHYALLSLHQLRASEKVSTLPPPQASKDPSVQTCLQASIAINDLLTQHVLPHDPTCSRIPQQAAFAFLEAGCCLARLSEAGIIGSKGKLGVSRIKRGVLKALQGISSEFPALVGFKEALEDTLVSVYTSL
ncbi:hypothetical protein SeLEV6574_g01682 [Synchytrium endobioticum]|uniref:Zn(2)-C6 fungal-type domain-containing protein n=2 Tax=Synchytrium endobioticum TaxID=286115 RepID=A0A507DCG8_9FUNG|nr:hypothetical protein SeLEV6574_g01682 [Synchytrium endobioticum]